MFCPFCGNNVIDNARHCPFCGANLKDEMLDDESSSAPSHVPEVDGRPSAPTPKTQDPPKTAPRITQAPTNTTGDSVKSSKKSPATTIVITVITILISVAVAGSCAQSAAERSLAASQSSHTTTSKTSTERQTEDVAEKTPKEEGEIVKVSEPKGSEEEGPTEVTEHTYEDNLKLLYPNEKRAFGLVMHLPADYFEITSNEDNEAEYRSFGGQANLTIIQLDHPGVEPTNLVEFLNASMEGISSQYETFELVEEPHEIATDGKGYYAARILAKTTSNESAYAPSTHILEMLLTDDGRLRLVEGACKTKNEEPRLHELETILGLIEIEETSE
ncbi:MAG: zinc ribbon domain-containing protein [Atopobiaceae bacterium]|nr:zinc ribbon domain-containing protein [Atopobiaceae bacterium]